MKKKSEKRWRKGRSEFWGVREFVILIESEM
jgi:hypothetical protein